LVSSKVIKVGSRGSKLALIQAEQVLVRLRQLYPDREFEVVIVRTQGDINKEAPLQGMGLGIFVKEIERLLLDGELDMAVHSLKDLPTTLPDGLVLGAMLELPVGPIARRGPHRHQQSPAPCVAEYLVPPGHRPTHPRQRRHQAQ